MPPKAKAKTKASFIDGEAEETAADSASSDVFSDDESRDVAGQRNEEETSESEAALSDEEDSRAVDAGAAGRKRKRRKTVAGRKGWRRLAIEERESVVNEGGIVWRAAQPLLTSLPPKTRRETTVMLRTILSNVEQRLDKLLVPQTTRMPHASRNVGATLGIASAPNGSMVGSVMSWQVERGERFFDGREDDESISEVTMLELGGFSSEIAVLESLLLPEATETVSLDRALVEQESILYASKEQLARLKEDRERRLLKADAGSELQEKLEKARAVLKKSSTSGISRAEALAMRVAAADSGAL